MKTFVTIIFILAVIFLSSCSSNIEVRKFDAKFSATLEQELELFLIIPSIEDKDDFYEAVQLYKSTALPALLQSIEDYKNFMNENKEDLEKQGHDPNSLLEMLENTRTEANERNKLIHKMAYGE